MDSVNYVETPGPNSAQEAPISSQPSILSPPRSSGEGPNGRKERRNPSITPRKFNRFFTPRGLQASSARQPLNEITSTTRNGVQSSPIPPLRFICGQENNPMELHRDSKRRKTIHTPDSMHDDSNGNTKQRGFLPLGDVERSKDEDDDIPQSSPCERATREMGCLVEESNKPPPKPMQRIIPLANRGLGGQLLNRSINGFSRGRSQYHTFPENGWQSDTASFYTGPKDVHMVTSVVGADRCIPFCVAACNTNSLVALGDEEGRVRLLESAKNGDPSFSSHYLAFRVHENAIIDLAFTDDDKYLATASGDQSARVVDMVTQQTTAILGYHSASLKQVRFQPGSSNNKILATSGRDGVVQLWDLRTKGDGGPEISMQFPVNESNRATTRSRPIVYGRPVNSIFEAHRSRNVGSKATVTTATADCPVRGEATGRVGEISVTAMQFLPAGQEHLLLTASEADASVRLWDVRFLYNKSKKTPTPVSITRQPESHNQWRHFGINSLSLNSNGSRLYTLCKDNTVYAYSTAHLITGHAPELAVTTENARPGPQRATQEGLGPLYGFRHPQLHATSFYVKSAVRKAKDGKSEILAVGSSDGCAILFPTDERYLPKPQYQEPEFGCGRTSKRQPPKGADSRRGIASRVEEDIPISTNGTALVRGHDREVSSLTWTSGGELVTVGDDFLVRCWREGDVARRLRSGGEGQGRRWGSGWADVDAKFDEDDV